MRDLVLRFTTGAAIVLSVAFAGSTAADAQSIMKVCGDQWKAAKAAGTTNGETWQQFLAQCRAQQKGGEASTTPAAAPTPAAPAPTSAGVKTASQCNEEYAANKAAIRASGQTKRAFVAACRGGNETIPQGAAAAPVPAPAPAPATGSLFPSPQPAAPSTNTASAPPPAPVEPPYSSLPRPIAPGEFASDEQASAHCPTDTVVWVNTKSRVYHFAGTHNYGHTKEGAYMCEADARAAGDRAAMNEKHP
jgi:hypothetical protein